MASDLDMAHLDLDPQLRVDKTSSGYESSSPKRKKEKKNRNVVD